jgi:hypothetical protein
LQALTNNDGVSKNIGKPVKESLMNFLLCIF